MSARKTSEEILQLRQDKQVHTYHIAEFFLQFAKLLIRNHCCTVYASTTTAPPPLSLILILFKVLEETKAHLEEERTVLEGQLNLAQLETTALQEPCAALEVSQKASLCTRVSAWVQLT